jgi:hypothetical protein
MTLSGGPSSQICSADSNANPCAVVRRRRTVACPRRRRTVAPNGRHLPRHTHTSLWDTRACHSFSSARLVDPTTSRPSRCAFPIVLRASQRDSRAFLRDGHAFLRGWHALLTDSHAYSKGACVFPRDAHASHRYRGTGLSFSRASLIGSSMSPTCRHAIQGRTYARLWDARAFQRDSRTDTRDSEQSPHDSRSGLVDSNTRRSAVAAETHRPPVRTARSRCIAHS